MLPLQLAEQLKARFPEVLSILTEFRGEITLQVTDSERIEEICAFAKKELGFNFLSDVSSVDNYETSPRFTVVYHIYGISHHCHLRLKTDLSEEKAELPSVTSVWRTADWHEREVYDMMGIRFRSHPDLRRILMWEGYPYNPLRKDFPLAGKPTDLPEVAFTKRAPLEGGPFVTTAGGGSSLNREPRSRVETSSDEKK